MIKASRITLAMLASAGLLSAGISPTVATGTEAKDLKSQVAQAMGIPSSQLGDAKRSTAVGLTVAKFQQHVDGVPVLGAQAIATMDESGKVLSVTGRVSDDVKIVGARGRAAVGQSTARGKALGHAKKVAKVPANAIDVGQSREVLVDPGMNSGEPTGALTPAIEYALRAPGGAFGTIAVDKFTGTVVDDAFGTMNLNRAICDRKNTYTDNTVCGQSLPILRAEGGAASSIPDVNSVYDQFGTASTWFTQTLGFDVTNKIGYDIGDGKGKALRADTRVCHYAVSGCPMVNAYWDGRQMGFGDGMTGADDVIVHEMSHGVSTANGISTGGGAAEYGAINEHMSDVFGEVYDQDTPTGLDGASYDWKIGEDLVGKFGRLIRDMKNPGSLGDPEKYSEYAAGTESHDGAGVGNKTAYLIAVGGTFNSQTITGIGRAKMAKLFYAVNATMSSRPTYADLGSLLNTQCQSLATTGTLTASDCANVSKATTATEIYSATRTKGKARTS